MPRVRAPSLAHVDKLREEDVDDVVQGEGEHGEEIDLEDAVGEIQDVDDIPDDVLSLVSALLVRSSCNAVEHVVGEDVPHTSGT